MVARGAKMRSPQEGLPEGFKWAVDAAPDATVVVDSKGAVVLSNTLVEKLFGYSREEVVAASLETLLPERFREAHRSHVARYLADPRPRPMGTPGAHFVGRRRDGTEFPIDISLNPVRVDGELFVLAAIRDVSAWNKLQEAVRQSESRFRTLYDEMPSVYFMVGLDRGIRSVNRFGAAALGFDAEDLVGRDVLDIFHEDDREAVSARLAAFATGVSQVASWEARKVRRDGGIIWVREHVRRIPGQDALLVLCDDITEQKAAGEALARSEERFRLLAEHATDLIELYDADAMCLYSSPSARKILGYAPEEFIGRSAFDFVHPDDQEMLARAHAEALRKKAADVYRIELRARHKDGHYRWLEALAQAHLDDATGDVKEFIVVSRDVTERLAAEGKIRRLNEALAKQVGELNSANEELEAFTYSASHDLKAPLRGIDMLSASLLDDYAEKFDDGGKQTLQMMRRSTRRMSQLVEDLLTFSRASKGEIRRQDVDLSKSCRDILAELAQRDAPRDVETIVESDVIASADTGLMSIVLVNLLGNAWKFTKVSAQPRIRFGTLTTKDGETAYFVEDNGAGFDMHQARRLFTPFQRLHSPQEFEGTGIGLATVHRIVERHGGRVWAEAETGRGAVFYFTLTPPVASDAGGESGPARASASRQREV